MRSILSLLLSAVFAWAATASAAPSSGWVTLENCELVENPYNDGDSFHVRHAGREYIFRLYFVDTPEESHEFTERLHAQAAYFGVDETRIMQTSDAARDFMRHTLATGFTVVTRWQGAQGRSKIPRHYAFVRVNDEDFAQRLVREGLARVYGVRATAPGGEPADAIRARLLALEDEARHHRRGAWEFARSLNFAEARAQAATSDLKVVQSPRLVYTYTTDLPRQRLGEIERDTSVRILEEFPDGWVRVQYEDAGRTSHEAYCLRWDLSLPDLPPADPAIRAEVAR
jgi:endonuclease YncB( thermonuclease family)